jgi:hypothetical protein
MTSTDAHPTLLPGISARGWQLALSVTLWIMSLALVAVFAVTVFHLIRNYNFAWFIPVFVAYGLVYAGVIMVKVRGNREAEAGYTTLPRAHPTLPQLDRVTGEVIRQAGDPYLVKSRRLSRMSDGAPIQPLSDDLPPSRWGGPLSLLPSFLIALVGMSLIFGAMGAAQGHPLESGLLTIAVVVALYVILLTIGASVVRARLARLQALAPSDFVFVFTRIRGYDEALNPVSARPTAASGYPPRGVSANSKGLSIWEGKPFVETAIIEWNVVTSIQVDNAPGSNISGTVALVTYRSDEGNLRGLPLANPRFDSFPTPSKAGVRWIVARLNALRTRSTTARIS